MLGRRRFGDSEDNYLLVSILRRVEPCHFILLTATQTSTSLCGTDIPAYSVLGSQVRSFRRCGTNSHFCRNSMMWSRPWRSRSNYFAWHCSAAKRHHTNFGVEDMDKHRGSVFLLPAWPLRHQSNVSNNILVHDDAQQTKFSCQSAAVQTIMDKETFFFFLKIPTLILKR